jgi:hypothetical protein
MTKVVLHSTILIKITLAAKLSHSNFHALEKAYSQQISADAICVKPQL